MKSGKLSINSDLLKMPLQNMMTKEKAGNNTLQTAPEQPQKIVFKKDYVKAISS